MNLFVQEHCRVNDDNLGGSCVDRVVHVLCGVRKLGEQEKFNGGANPRQPRRGLFVLSFGGHTPGLIPGWPVMAKQGLTRVGPFRYGRSVVCRYVRQKLSPVSFSDTRQALREDTTTRHTRRKTPTLSLETAQGLARTFSPHRESMVLHITPDLPWNHPDCALEALTKVFHDPPRADVWVIHHELGPVCASVFFSTHATFLFRYLIVITFAINAGVTIYGA